MTIKNEEVVRKFMMGERKGGSKHLFIEGNILYSYGHHFPLALRKAYHCYILVTDKYSSSTSHHQSMLRHAIQGDGNHLIETTLKDFPILKAAHEMQKVI